MVKALNSTEGIKHFLATVPATIALALDRPPVSELIRLGAKKESIEACLALQITKAASMLTVGGNLREGQALEIAIQLIADYPNDSLEDFCLCLRRGVKGAYGDIFRFDVLVINGWMKQYMDEKCQAAEDKLMDEKETYKEQFNWKPQAVPNEKVKEYLKEWEMKVLDSKVEVKEEFKKELKQRGTGYKDPHTPEWYALREKIRREASEFYKDKYTLSGMKIYPIRDQEIFAESEQDAEEIFKRAMKS